MKKAIILRVTGGELANQLWNYVSVYASCLEEDLSLENPAFFEYGNYFTMPAANLFFKLFFFLPFTNYKKRKSSFSRRLWRKFYNLYADIIRVIHKNSILASDNLGNKPFYLPPTQTSQKLLELKKATSKIYFDGWLFRNPVGLQKYRKEILEYFRPRADIERAVSERIQELREKFKHVIGVHIRQGDYRNWRGGAYFLSQTRVQEILDAYLQSSGYSPSETHFAITSDEPVDVSLFNGLNVSVSKESAVYDLFLLSKTDTVLGSDSTFGAFASYYGDISFIVMQKEKMDWAYYVDKKSYFENKYSTFVQY